MFKYAARHWAHYDCWLEVKGKEIPEPWIYRGILSTLQMGMYDWQLRQFPVFKLAEWVEKHKVQCEGRTPVDKACWLLKKAIELNQAVAVKV
jgi:hypothetical protein